MPKRDGRIRFLVVRPALSCGPFALVAEVSYVDSPEVSLSVRIDALAVSPSLPSLTLELDGTP